MDIFPHFSAHFYTMTQPRLFAKSSLILAVLFLFINSSSIKAADGKALFASNCAQCHNVWKDGTGPALNGVEERWGGKRTDIYTWINNFEAAVAKGIPEAVKIVNYSSSAMNKFPNLKTDEIDAILDYIKGVPDPKLAAKASGNGDEGDKQADNSLLFGVLSGILLIISLTLLYINSNLRKVSQDKEGIISPEPVPFYRNKAYLGLFAIVAFILTGYNLGKSAMGLGRSKNYQPEQPIYYSHKVHAGVNQINCLYCHTGAQEGKQATIPSVNVCMNCHMNINEYSGNPKLFREDGSEVNGTAEIKKLYEYAGYSGKAGEVWNPATAKANPIPWIKIHNLPDHVYFNHSQHVKVGQVECQKCHGEIQEMGEVKQHSDLSMGWCINCHRETGVNFAVDKTTGKTSGNKYYEQYSKLHEDMKKGKKDKLTVENIGGTECQKCHY